MLPTRYIAHYISDADALRAASDERASDSIRKADARLLMQDARRPVAAPYAFPQGLEQYPRRGVPLGSNL